MVGWLLLIAIGCWGARTVFRNAESSDGGRASLLVGITGIPVSIPVKSRERASSGATIPISQKS
jgi:hypothetical protein